MASPGDNRIALELEQARPYLRRFALLQLRNGIAAEDAVQETLLAALQAVRCLRQFPQANGAGAPGDARLPRAA
jgi:DNA-directed RNA polymerase specialized sigma24 family protein